MCACGKVICTYAWYVCISVYEEKTVTSQCDSLRMIKDLCRIFYSMSQRGIMTKCEVIMKADIGSDHRLVRMTISVSAQNGILVFGKAHTCSAPSLSSLPKVAFETVPVFVWLNTDHSWPRRVECQLLPFSTPLSFGRSMLRCSGLSMFRKFLKPLSTSALPSCRPDVMSVVLASLFSCPFPLTPACPGQ